MALTTLESLSVDDKGAVSVAVTQHLGRQLLPAVVARIVPGDLALTYREIWRPDSAGIVRGQVAVSASGGLGSSRAENVLAPAAAGAELRVAIRVQVRIPVVGGQLEKTIGASLADSVPSVLDFTTGWIAENL